MSLTLNSQSALVEDEAVGARVVQAVRGRQDGARADERRGAEDVAQHPHRGVARVGHAVQDRQLASPHLLDTAASREQEDQADQRCAHSTLLCNADANVPPWSFSVVALPYPRPTPRAGDYQPQRWDT